MKLAFSLTETEGHWLLRTNLIDGGNARVLEQEFLTASEATTEILTQVAEHEVVPPAPDLTESEAIIINPEQGKESPAAVKTNEAP